MNYNPTKIVKFVYLFVKLRLRQFVISIVLALYLTKNQL
jgi:hypothetical protein